MYELQSAQYTLLAIDITDVNNPIVYKQFTDNAASSESSSSATESESSQSSSSYSRSSSSTSDTSESSSSHSLSESSVTESSSSSSENSKFRARGLAFDGRYLWVCEYYERDALRRYDVGSLYQVAGRIDHLKARAVKTEELDVKRDIMAQGNAEIGGTVRSKNIVAGKIDIGRKLASTGAHLNEYTSPANPIKCKGKVADGTGLNFYDDPKIWIHPTDVDSSLIFVSGKDGGAGDKGIE